MRTKCPGPNRNAVAAGYGLTAMMVAAAAGQSQLSLGPFLPTGDRWTNGLPVYFEGATITPDGRFMRATIEHMPGDYRRGRLQVTGGAVAFQPRAEVPQNLVCGGAPSEGCGGEQFPAGETLDGLSSFTSVGEDLCGTIECQGNQQIFCPTSRGTIYRTGPSGTAPVTPWMISTYTPTPINHVYCARGPVAGEGFGGRSDFEGRVLVGERGTTTDVNGYAPVFMNIVIAQGGMFHTIPGTLSMRHVPHPGAETGTHYEVSHVADDAAVVVLRSWPAPHRTYTATPSTAPVLLPLPAGATDAHVSAITRDGSFLVGRAVTPAGDRGAVWHNGALITFPGEVMIPTTVSPDGLVVGGVSVAQPPVAMVWTQAGGARIVEDLAHVDFGLDISAAGCINSVQGIAVNGTSESDGYVLAVGVCNAQNPWRLVIPAPCGGGTEARFTGAGGASFSDTANWHENNAPGSDNEVAVFDRADLYAVSFDYDTGRVEALDFRDGEVTLDLANGVREVHSGNTVCDGWSVRVSKDSGASASLTVGGGEMRTNLGLWVSPASSSLSELRVTPGTRVDLGIGNPGTGLRLSDGADSVGSVHVGAGAELASPIAAVASGTRSYGAIFLGSSGKIGLDALSLATGPASTAEVEIEAQAEVEADDVIVSRGAESTTNLSIAEDALLRVSNLLAMGVQAAQGNPPAPGEAFKRVVAEVRGLLDVAAGQMLAGDGPNSSVDVTLAGDGEAVADVLVLGRHGRGAITVNDRGELRTSAAVLGEHPDSLGEISVSGPDAKWTHDGGFGAPVRIGRGGSGLVTVTSGGVFEFTPNSAPTAALEFGTGTDAIGQVNIVGTGSEVNTSGTIIGGGNGPNALGRLLMGGGGKLSAGAAVFGGDGGRAEFTLSHADLTFASANPDPANGNGFLFHNGNIMADAGTVLRTTGAAIAPAPGQNVIVTLDGPGTVWTLSGDVFLGVDPASGQGGGAVTVNVTNGARIEACDANLTTGAGVTINVPVITVGCGPRTAGIRVGGLLLTELSPGIDLNTVSFGPGGTLGGSATWPAPFVNTGEVVPGLYGRAGVFTIDGAYTQEESGSLVIDMQLIDRGSDPCNPGLDHDRLDVIGTAHLGGNLRIQVDDGLAAYLRGENHCSWIGGLNTATVLTASTITGQFAAAEVVNLDGWRAEVMYTANSVVVTLIEICFADFNQDGGIDGADVDAFFAAWEAGDAAADTNLDGGIDGSDVQSFFAVWENGGCT